MLGAQLLACNNICVHSCGNRFPARRSFSHSRFDNSEMARNPFDSILSQKDIRKSISALRSPKLTKLSSVSVSPSITKCFSVFLSLLIKYLPLSSDKYWTSSMFMYVNFGQNSAICSSPLLFRFLKIKVYYLTKSFYLFRVWLMQWSSVSDNNIIFET